MSFKTRSEYSIGSFRTLSGLCMIINFFLLLMTFLIVVTWRIKVIWFNADENYSTSKDISDYSLYFLIALGVPLFAAILLYIKEISTVVVPIQHGLAAVFMMTMCVVFGVLIIVSATFLYMKTRQSGHCNQWRCQQITCAIIMSYINAAGLLLQSFFHLTEKNVVMTFM